MPAAAVIPAPIAYIKVVAVKKLVVELQAWLGGLPNGMYCPAGSWPAMVTTGNGGLGLDPGEGA